MPDLHPSLLAWEDARVASGIKPSSARVARGHLSAMANRLGIPAPDLPDDAVRRHFDGTTAKSRTSSEYHNSFMDFRRWLDVGSRAFASHELDVEHLADPDLMRWAKRLRLSKAPNSIHTYIRNVELFARHAEKGAADLTEDDVVSYLDYADEKNLGKTGHVLRANTVKAKLGALRRFFKFLKKEDITAELRDELKAQTADRGETSTEPVEQSSLAALLDRTELDRILGPERAEEARRARLLLLLGATMGLRVHEMHGVSVEDLKWSGGKWRLTLFTYKGGKRHKEILVTASAQVIADFHENWAGHSGRIMPESWTVNQTRAFMTGYGVRHGYVFHPHQLRARFATDFYEATGHDIVAVQRYMRHKHISTTERYIKVSSKTEDVALGLGTQYTARIPKQYGPPVTVGGRVGRVSA